MATRYRVEVAARAKLDLREIHEWIAQDRKRAAAKWLRDVLARIRALARLPFAHEVIPEAEELNLDCRHTIYKNYRIIYRVEDRTVMVLRVVHAARLLTQRFFDQV